MFCFFCHNFAISVFTVTVNIFLCLAYVYWSFPVYCVSFSYPVWFLFLVNLSIFTWVDYFCPCLFPTCFTVNKVRSTSLPKLAICFLCLFFHVEIADYPANLDQQFVFLFVFLSLYPEFSTPDLSCSILTCTLSNTKSQTTTLKWQTMRSTTKLEQ